MAPHLAAPHPAARPSCLACAAGLSRSCQPPPPPLVAAWQQRLPAPLPGLTHLLSHPCAAADIGQFHTWLLSKRPDGQPIYLLTLLPGYPLLNFAAVTALYVALSHRLFATTSTLKDAVVSLVGVGWWGVGLVRGWCGCVVGVGEGGAQGIARRAGCQCGASLASRPGSCFCLLLNGLPWPGTRAYCACVEAQPTHRHDRPPPDQPPSPTPQPPCLLPQVPHDDNRLLLRNLLMMCMVAGVAACFGFLLVEARKMVAP